MDSASPTADRIVGSDYRPRTQGGLTLAGKLFTKLWTLRAVTPVVATALGRRG